MNTTNKKKYPLSLMQHQFWLLNTLYPENSVYNIKSVFEIDGLLNIKSFEKSINTYCYKTN